MQSSFSNTCLSRLAKHTMREHTRMTGLEMDKATCNEVTIYEQQLKVSSISNKGNLKCSFTIWICKHGISTEKSRKLPSTAQNMRFETMETAERRRKIKLLSFNRENRIANAVKMNKEPNIPCYLKKPHQGGKGH